jgi:hypothetical protein
MSGVKKERAHMHNHTLSPTWSYHGATSYIDSVQIATKIDQTQLRSLNALAVLNDWRHRGKTRINSQIIKQKDIKTQIAPLVFFLHFLWQLFCCFALSKIYCRCVFCKGTWNPHCSFMGKKQKEVHKTEILVSVAKVFANVGSLAQSSMQDAERTWVSA